MPNTNPQRSRKKFFIIMLALFLLVGGTSAYWYLQQTMQLPLPGFTASKPSTTPAPVRPKPAPQPSKPVQPVPQDTGIAHKTLNSPSTLGELARMRGQKQILEQRVKIAELQNRLDELSNPAPKKEPEVTPIPVLTPAKLSSLEPPVTVTPAALENTKGGPMVVSVQGADGMLSATIRKKDGSTVTINNGASFNGGILHVSRKGVSVKRNGKLSPIPFE